MTADDLIAHLATGATHVCNCWAINRRDGVTLGFTDHDLPLQFDGIDFMPESGLSARALSSTTGLSVNNTETIGVLQDDAITEADIEAGRYDGATVTTWLVQWDSIDNRVVRFVGTIGEMTRADGGFQAELRGLTDALNQPQGRSFLRNCSAILGDARCTVDLADPAYFFEQPVTTVQSSQFFGFTDIAGFNDRWFEAGELRVLSGAAAGLSAVIKADKTGLADRMMTLWQPLGAAVMPGDLVRVTAGCDKRSKTCAQKFSNLINFQGFPDIPGEDWLMDVPRNDGQNTGGSRSR
ncbi:DUF2163 domain-containing protein [Yoonia sp. SS1-5]|uniref:DUF2163 domain-containing protein n=1 Tax=Yoonia rhodophyticola TaxID=3137370 RepID=A0AAN0NHD1_9RHOB